MGIPNPRSLNTSARTWGLGFLALLVSVCGHAHDSEEDLASAEIQDFSLDCDLSQYQLQPRSDREDLNHKAAEVVQLLESVEHEQLPRFNYCVGDAEMYSWTNVPGRRSGGIRLGDLSDVSRERAWDALRALLSENGFAKVELLATDIERASGAGTVADYTIAVFGNPRIDSAWGLQFDGHHIALNFLAHGNNLILAPLFLGAQPLTTNGQTPLSDEIHYGRKLFHSLSEEQRNAALKEGLVRRDVMAGSGSGHVDRGKDFSVEEFANVGIPLSELSDPQMDLARDLLEVYLSNLASPHAEEVHDAIEPKITSGFFTFSRLGDRVYYRIYIPDALLIEYDDVASDHLHTVMRLLDEQHLNDYGPFASNASQNTTPLLTLVQHYVHDRDHKDSTIFAERVSGAPTDR